ncbi:uncharacterized protein LOC118204333 [Stegodyphus dumicola]|uniref:uncharacterized protein LOC118204333 n=1 Tax=Stegodyphus dumicola TaxID=202533 RepID=UPI0015AD9A5E|nr:uncharacterized protein LOC118204333 [Stegodyphus dumicola]
MKCIGHIRSTAVTPGNIACVENRRVTVHDIAAKVNISVRSFEAIIHNHLCFCKICARWVPCQLTLNQKLARMTVCKQLLNWFRAKGDELLQPIITCDKICLNNSTLEIKRSSMEWRHKGSPPPKKSKMQPSAGRSWQSSGT